MMVEHAALGEQLWVDHDSVRCVGKQSPVSAQPVYSRERGKGASHRSASDEV